jgi:hypothetical protein
MSVCSYLLSMVEEIDGPQARDDAIAELRNFAIVRAFPFAPFSFAELLHEHPFKFPLKGFPGATKISYAASLQGEHTYSSSSWVPPFLSSLCPLLKVASPTTGSLSVSEQLNEIG